MKSICIKITDSNSIEYLLENLSSSELEDVYFSCKKFKIYTNIIIHFKGKNEKTFIKDISKILANLVLNLYEQKFIKMLIKSEYFYFDSFEQNKISENTYDDLYNLEESIYNPQIRFKILTNCFYEYLSLNHSIILKGFITFRIKKYLETLLEQIDKSVNKYIIEREYIEFISLLKIYINSEPSSIDVVHLLYNNCNPTLLDKNNNIIEIEEDILNTKYLSDISFSSNDFALNTLLSLVPQKIYIHLLDGTIDEFINTIKLIFEDRVEFCSDYSVGTVKNQWSRAVLNDKIIY